MIAYYNGKFMPKSEIRISPDDRGFLFADGVYEVFLSFNGKLFGKKDHFERLARSMAALRIGGADFAELEKIPDRLIRENGLDKGSASVYLQVTRGEAPRKHVFPPDTPLTVYGYTVPFEPDEAARENGVKVILVPDIRWLRCDIKSLALLPNVMAAQQAAEKGARDAIFVRDGAVTEGAYNSFGAVFDGVFTTYPESCYILPGITRKIVLELCLKMDIPVSLFPVLREQLETADECMIFGTTTEMMPVVRMDDRPVGNGKPGPVTRRLQKALREMIRGTFV